MARCNCIEKVNFGIKDYNIRLRKSVQDLTLVEVVAIRKSKPWKTTITAVFCPFCGTQNVDMPGPEAEGEHVFLEDKEEPEEDEHTEDNSYEAYAEEDGWAGFEDEEEEVGRED